MDCLKKFNLKGAFALVFIFSFVILGCSDKADTSETDESKFIGYWAITHIRTIEQIGGVCTTIERDVPPHGVDGYAGGINYRYDVLIFDAEFVTVRGDMPSRPKSKDYDLEIVDEHLRYAQELANWENCIGERVDELGCPVGRYLLNGAELIVGSLNMGVIEFVSNSEFKLSCTKPLSSDGDYRQLIYTYSRIASLIL